MPKIRKENWYIVNRGQGGFLNPPGHAEHNYSVWEGRKSNPHTCTSLSHAIEQPYVPEAIKEQARQLLRDNPGEVKNEGWIRSMYAYFAHCYSPDGVDRNASNCIVPTRLLELGYNPEWHLAYLHVKQFDPEHTVRQDLIDRSLMTVEQRRELDFNATQITGAVRERTPWEAI